jgi:hypothetical protein
VFTQKELPLGRFTINSKLTSSKKSTRGTLEKSLPNNKTGVKNQQSNKTQIRKFDDASSSAL